MEENENKRADENNAKNIHNAAEVAIASKHPIASAAGHAVKVADRLTGGKASQKLGKVATKLNRHSHMGNITQKFSNMAAESGASDAVGQAAAMSNGTPDGGSTDVGQQNLQASFAKRAQNFINQKRKKKKNEDENNNENNDGNSENESQETSDDDQDKKDSKAKIRKKMIIKITLYAIAIIVPLLCIFVIILVIADYISSFGALLGKELYERSAYKDQENKYYEHLKQMEKEYKETCGNDEFNANYFHVALTYQYYVEKPDTTEDEQKSDETDFAGIPVSEYEILNNALNRDLKYIYDDLLVYCHINYSKEDAGHSETSGYSMYTGMYDLISGGSAYLNRIYLNEAKKRDTIRTGQESIIASKEAYQEILNEIFDYAEMVTDANTVKDEAIPESLAVDNVDESKSILVKEYIAGVIYANVDKNDLTNSEKLKAYTVAYTTNIMSKNNISINTQSISSKSLSNFKYCDPNTDCNGKGSISDIAKNNITNSIESVYGNVLVNSNGQYDTLNIDNLNNADGNDYAAMLANAYTGYTIRNAKEDVYDNGVNYGNETILTPIIFYDQRDYKGSFCGLKNEVIARSGCGVTSMAMIVSTYENNKKYDPVYMNEEARKKGHCSSGNGTYYSHFTYQSKVFGYKYLAVKKTSDATKLNLVTSHLRKGHFVILHVGEGQFTSGGHYMVLGGIDPSTKSVYVYDPYNSYNSVHRKTGTGWYKFSDILKQAKPAKTHTAFHIIWKE